MTKLIGLSLCPVVALVNDVIWTLSGRQKEPSQWREPLAGCPSLALWGRAVSSGYLLKMSQGPSCIGLYCWISRFFRRLEKSVELTRRPLMTS